MAGRHEAMVRNLDFFGAPQAALLFVPAVGDSVRVASDLGMYAQTFLLSLTAHGFAGIPQTLLGLFAAPIRAHLGVADDMKLLFGISFGYADPAALAAAPSMPREPINSITLEARQVLLVSICQRERRRPVSQDSVANERSRQGIHHKFWVST